MADGCFYTEDADSIQKIFTQNFLEHYTKSKAPFPLFFHAAWFFNRPHRKDGFLKFIDSILALPDVYFVTSQELIAWTRYPEPLPQVTYLNILLYSNLFIFFRCILPQSSTATSPTDQAGVERRRTGVALATRGTRGSSPLVSSLAQINTHGSTTSTETDNLITVTIK